MHFSWRNAIASDLTLLPSKLCFHIDCIDQRIALLITEHGYAYQLHKEKIFFQVLFKHEHLELADLRIVSFVLVIIVQAVNLESLVLELIQDNRYRNRYRGTVWVHIKRERGKTMTTEGSFPLTTGFKCPLGRVQK